MLCALIERSARSAAGNRGNLLTNFREMVGLSVSHRLGFIGAKLDCFTCYNPSSIVGKLKLLAWLNKFYPGFGNNSAICLLQVLKNLLVVSSEWGFIVAGAFAVWTEGLCSSGHNALRR